MKINWFLHNLFFSFSKLGQLPVLYDLTSACALLLQGLPPNLPPHPAHRGVFQETNKGRKEFSSSFVGNLSRIRLRNLNTTWILRAEWCACNIHPTGAARTQECCYLPGTYVDTPSKISSLFFSPLSRFYLGPLA